MTAPKSARATDADFDLCNSTFLRVIDYYGSEPEANTLPDPHRAVLLTWYAMGIIDNGGFHFFFEHDFSGDPGFTLTAEAFDEIGCHSAAQAVRDAIALFPKGKVIADIEDRLKLFESTPESRRTALNKKFWAASNVGMGEICVKLAAYIRNHQADFANINPR